MNFEDFTPVQLDEILTHFYLDARTLTGELYRGKSLASLRYGLNRHLNTQPNQKFVDIMRDPQFSSSNLSFQTAMKELKENGKACVDNTPAIDTADLTKLYRSMHLRTDTPSGLANKVQMDVRLYFFRRGNENFHQMTKDTFQIQTETGSGKKYVKKRLDELTKNRRENDTEIVSGVMLETGGDFCPVASFEKYLGLLHADCNRLWQYPNICFGADDTRWFSNRPLGINTLRNFTKRLSKMCGLSREYTNHSVRATGATMLTDANFSASDIMSVTGHKSVSSLTVYQKTSVSRKQQMSEAITSRINPLNMPGPSAPATVTSESLIETQTAAGPSSLPLDVQSTAFYDAESAARNDISTMDDIQLASMFDEFDTPGRSGPTFVNCRIGTVNIHVHKL